MRVVKTVGVVQIAYQLVEVDLDKQLIVFEGAHAIGRKILCMNSDVHIVKMYHMEKTERVHMHIVVFVILSLASLFPVALVPVFLFPFLDSQCRVFVFSLVSLFLVALVPVVPSLVCLFLVAHVLVVPSQSSHILSYLVAVFPFLLAIVEPTFLVALVQVFLFPFLLAIVELVLFALVPSFFRFVIFHIFPVFLFLVLVSVVPY